MVQLLTLLLLYLLHIKTRPIVISASCIQQKEETTVLTRHTPLRQGQTQELCSAPSAHQQ